MFLRNLMLASSLLLSQASAYAISCAPYEWLDIIKVGDTYRFSLSQKCELGVLPDINVEDINRIAIRQKKQMASEVFLEQVDDPDYAFSSEETLKLKNGRVKLLSKNYAKVMGTSSSLFRSSSEVLEASSQAKYIDSLNNQVEGEVNSAALVQVKVGTSIYLKKPPLPIDLLKDKIKKDMEEDLSKFAADLHNAILTESIF